MYRWAALLAVLLTAGCADAAPKGVPTVTTTVSAAQSGGSATFVWAPVSGCFSGQGYVAVPLALTGITYLINGVAAAQAGQVDISPGAYHVTAVAAPGFTASDTGPWDFTVPIAC